MMPERAPGFQSESGATEPMAAHLKENLWSTPLDWTFTYPKGAWNLDRNLPFG